MRPRSLEFRSKNGRALNRRAACSGVAAPVAPDSVGAIATMARAVAATVHRQAVMVGGDPAAQARVRRTVHLQEAHRVDHPAIIHVNRRHRILRTIFFPVRRRDKA